MNQKPERAARYQPTAEGNHRGDPGRSMGTEGPHACGLLDSLSNSRRAQATRYYGAFG